ncbi:MAG: TonB-dependent receptor, partial [Thermoanaerobaculia bacterium]
MVDQVSDLSTTRLVSSGAPLWHAAAANFAPRIGVAYQLFDSSRWATVLRGGAGLFYDVGFGQLGDVFADNAQYYGQTTYTSNVAFPLTAAQQTPPPLAGTTLPVTQAAVFDPRLKLPYTIEWNFSIEQRLGTQQTLSASYVGAAGRRSLLETYYFRPNPSFNALFVTKNGATSDYDALQLQFRRQLSRGLQALASYTWSHSIDTGSAGSSFSFSNALVPEFGAGGNRGPSDFDIRHGFSAAVTYDIPTPKMTKWATAVLRGWSLHSLIQARSAQAVNISDANFFEFNGGILADVRPDLVPGAPLYLHGSRYPGGK